MSTVWHSPIVNTHDFPNPGMRVLDHGHVYATNRMGDDLSIVNAARVSFNQRSETLDTNDEGLIRFLMRERHGSPFEHVTMTFVVKAPIMVFREWHRHRIASYNEMSGRYTKLMPEFYLPPHEQIRKQVGKPGAYSYEPINDELKSNKVRSQLLEVYAQAWSLYDQLLKDGIAKEVARLCLPVALYSEMWFTVNLRGLFNFLSLRTAENAQWEIRQYANAIEHLTKSHVPLAMEAFINNGRICP